MEAVTITLDGVEVSGYSGMTILDLARDSGVDIPTLCHDPHLNPTGACRLCLVEDDSSGALLASCVVPIRPGMVINTRSPRVIERRKVIVQFMLASHPDSCLVCDKGNRCQLRKLASEMGIGLLDFQRLPQSAAIQDVNPFIERDLSRCILCAKCIRADQELVVEGAIDYMDRGFTAKPATLGDVPLEESACTFCGTCVAMCPTGALMEKERSYHGTTTTTVDSICPFCGCGCSISLEVKDNKVVRVKPGTKSQVNRGTLCVRGSYGYDFVHSNERLTSPLIKVDGSFQEASWEQALGHISGEFKRIKEDHGASSLAILGSSKCTNEENYLLQRLARAVLGTNNIDNGSRLYNPATRFGLGQSIGFPSTTNTIDKIEDSEVIMVIGANPTASAPAVSYAIKRAVNHRNARLLLIDPRETGLAPFANLWLRPEVGTDVVLLNELCRVIIDEKLFDEEFVTRRTDNFEELVRSLKDNTPEYAQSITGISSEDIQLAAQLLAGAQRASIVYGNGITQHINGTDNVTALANLAMLNGNVGQRGGGIFALQRENNGLGACDMGTLPDFLPGYQSLDDDQVRKGFEEHWGVDLPAEAGLTAIEMIERAATGGVKGMLIVGENPVSGFPNPSAVRDALTSLDFLVTTDLFLTETAELATVVLPAASFAEKEGTFTNFEGRVQQIHKAVEPVGDSMPDWEIILQLASAMGQSMPYSTLQQVMTEIEDLVPLYQYLADADLKIEGLGRADLESERLRARRLFKGLFPSGFGRFSPVEYNQPVGQTDNGYPFTLVSGSILYQFGSGTRSLKASRLRRFWSESWLEINEDDAEYSGYGDGDVVRVISPIGEVTTTVRVTNALPKGLLFMPVSFPESPVNKLYGVNLDPRAKAPSFKPCAVRLERINPDG
ncbi:MAG: formate dehydrogenase subunit alpha [Dehalococcoidales bacterium]|nr:MAG: formate dehydrogenase subunit alpha [Dehalococcoidales bacterium]